VQAVIDRGWWGARTVEVTLADGEAIILKLGLQGEGTEARALAVLRAHGLPAPRILAVDTSQEIMPCSYIIVERVGGARLSDLLDRVDEPDALSIYETLGRLYRKMHAVHNDWSGVWWDIPNKPLPNDYMYRAEIVGGSGKQALEQGRIAQRTYDREEADAPLCGTAAAVRRHGRLLEATDCAQPGVGGALPGGRRRVSGRDRAGEG
jgi:phosphotransferase family enzyme